MHILDCYRATDDAGARDYILVLRFSEAEGEQLAAATDPAVATTPPAAESRAVTRPIGLQMRDTP